MSGEETVCALTECTNTFMKRVHNQRFCSPECCRIHTNARILEQYHLKKNKVMKGRVCEQKGCDTLLSRYNHDEYCAIHQQAKHIEKLRGWGWNVDEDGQIIS